MKLSELESLVIKLKRGAKSEDPDISFWKWTEKGIIDCVISEHYLGMSYKDIEDRCTSHNKTRFQLELMSENIEND